MNYLLFFILLYPQASTPEIPPVEAIIEQYEVLEAEVSAYTNSVEETDDTPNIMASGLTVYEGAIACPRRYPFKTIVEIEDREYICEDRMNIRYTNHFDIFMYNREEALAFGRQVLEVKVR